MKASRYVKPFEQDVDKWERTLSLIMEVVEMILTVQRQWMYLEVCIFRNIWRYWLTVLRVIVGRIQHLRFDAYSFSFLKKIHRTNFKIWDVSCFSLFRGLDYKKHILTFFLSFFPDFFTTPILVILNCLCWNISSFIIPTNSISRIYSLEKISENNCQGNQPNLTMLTATGK